MYPITNEVKALFESEQRKVLRITGADKNGAVISITDNDVIEDSFQIDRYSCNGEKLEVGTAIAGQLTLKLENGNGQYDGIVFEGAELFVEVGIADWTQSSPTVTYIPCGYFTPDEQPRRLSTISITALDRMTKFDAVVDGTQITTPITVANLVARVCTLRSVTLGQSITGLTNANVSLPSIPTGNSVTYRNLIAWCAGIMGTNAWIDWNGQLRFSWYNNTTGYASTVDNRYSSDMYENDLTVTGMVYTTTGSIDIVEGTDDYALDLTGNTLAAPMITTILPALNTALNGFSYRPFTAAAVNAPYLWPMDAVTFTDKEGNEHASLLTNVCFGLNGTTAMEARGMTYVLNRQKLPEGFTKEQAQLINEVSNQIKDDIDDSLTQQDIFNRLTENGTAQGLVLYNGQLYINASYINAGYLSANRIAAGAISADKIAAGAITTDKIAANAITASKIAAGAITADMITSGEMSAARIKGGTLTLGGIGNTRGTLQILNGFDEVAGGWDRYRMFSNAIQLTYFNDDRELEVAATIGPLYQGGIYIDNQDDSSDTIATISPDMTALHNNLYVFDGASIKGVLRLPDEPLYVQYGGTGATTAADARANLGITPANIGAAADSAAMQYRGWYPNGQSMLSLTPGYYRTSPNNLPSETFPSGIGYYGTLCVDNTGYTHITYIGVLGDFMIWKSNSPDRWYVVQRQGSVPVSSGGTGATTILGAVQNLFSTGTDAITEYPDKPGIYRITRDIFAHMNPVSSYGVLVIFKATYGMHLYLDLNANLYVGYSGETFGEPATWKIVTSTVRS